MKILLFLIVLSFAMTVSAQVPPIEPGVPHELAKWRAEHYSDIRYELDLTLEKMAPTMRGTLAVKVTVRTEKKGLRTEEGDGRRETGDRKAEAVRGPAATDSSLITRYSSLPVILDWRRISGHEKLSRVFNVRINGRQAEYEEVNEHLVFRKGVVEGKNRIELEFESPILTSGSAITRYVDKEDGSEYIYSLFVPSDASTAFPVFDQPDLKARFELMLRFPKDWSAVSNGNEFLRINQAKFYNAIQFSDTKPISTYVFAFAAGPFEVIQETENRRPKTGGRELSESNIENRALLRPEGATDNSPGWSRRRNPGDSGNTIPSRFSGDSISTRSGSDGPSDRVPIRLFVRKSQAHKLTGSADAGEVARGPEISTRSGSDGPSDRVPIRLFVRKSQAHKLTGSADAGEVARGPSARAPVTRADEVFRLNREAIEYLEDYFDYPFPFPKYDVVLIPEFPFGGMEHAGATFLRETSVIFPTEPTANNYISRASVIFHEAAHQWFGDTVTMKWFDDLWLKEGFATFMAYKTMEKVLPEYDPWKVFYQRVKPTAYATDVTKGTVPIYQDIPNLNSAKSAYGAIVYQKAPSFLRQAEFYLGEDKFKQAVRSFLKDNEYSNAEWSDLVGAFEKASGKQLGEWAKYWVKEPGLVIYRVYSEGLAAKDFGANLEGVPADGQVIQFVPEASLNGSNMAGRQEVAFQSLVRFRGGKSEIQNSNIPNSEGKVDFNSRNDNDPAVVMTNHFLYDKPPIELILPNFRDYGYGIFLLDERSRNYILKNIREEKDEFLRAQMWGSLWDSVRFAELAPLDYINLAIKNIDNEKDETTISSILGRTAYAYTYYLSEKQQIAVAPRLESLLVDKMNSAPTVGQRITYFRSLLGVAKGENARKALKELYAAGAKNSEVRSQESENSGSNQLTLAVGDKNSSGGATDGSPAQAEGAVRGTGPNISFSRFSGDTISTRSGSDGPNARVPSGDGHNQKLAPIRDTGAGKPAAKQLTDPTDAGEVARGPNARGPSGGTSAGEVVARQLIEGGHKARPYTGPPFPVKAKDRFDIATRLIVIGDPDGAKFLAELEKTEKDDAALRWAYAVKAGFATKENKAKYWKDFTQNKEISESWIEEAFEVWNSPSHSELTLPYLDDALAELPDLKRNRKIFFVNGWLGAFIGGQDSKEALDVVNKFLEENPGLDADLRRKILENVDGLERAVKIRAKFGG